MKLVGRSRLETAMARGGPAAKWLTSWVAEIRNGHWKRSLDFKGEFPRSVQIGDGTFLFRCPHSEIQITVHFAFSLGIAIIVGTEEA